MPRVCLPALLALTMLPLGVAAQVLTPLTEEDRAREVCLGLRPTERVEFPENPSERAAAVEAFEAAREGLRASRFAVELPWADFTVADWRPQDRSVRLATERPFRALEGRLILFDLDHESLDLEAFEGRDALLAEGLAKGTLTLLVAFQPAEEESCPCTVSKLGELSLAVDLLAAELRLDSLPVARAVGKGFISLARTAGEPAVEIRAADLVEGAASEKLVAAVRAAAGATRDCYAKGLARNPGLDGALVLDLASDAAGRLVVAATVADSLQDQAVAACVLAALKEATAPKETRGTVVIELSAP